MIFGLLLRGRLRQVLLYLGVFQGISQFSHIVSQPYVQWCSEKAEKVTHIKGRILDQVMNLFNCVPFLKMRISLKGNNFFISSSLKYGKSLLSH